MLLTFHWAELSMQNYVKLQYKLVPLSHLLMLSLQWVLIQEYCNGPNHIAPCYCCPMHTPSGLKNVQFVSISTEIHFWVLEKALAKPGKIFLMSLYKFFSFSRKSNFRFSNFMTSSNA